MRIFLITIVLSLTNTTWATPSFDSIENLFSTKGVTTNFPTSFGGANLPILISFSQPEVVARAYCELQNRKLMTYTEGTLDFPDQGESWEYDDDKNLFIKKPFDYSYLEGVHERTILTSATCGTPLNTCENQ